jgi:hypothetical protein
MGKLCVDLDLVVGEPRGGLIRVVNGCADGAHRKRDVIMMRTLFASGCLAGLVIMGAAAPAYAAPNPGGTGPPGASCEEVGHQPGNTFTNGSPGSPFGPTGGTGGAHYTEKSQYDVACYQQSQKADSSSGGSGLTSLMPTLPKGHQH